MKKVYVEMIADLFHYGHVEFLRNAKALGDYLVVGVLSDEWATTHKRTPVIKQEERLRVVEACRYVDEVLLQNDPASADWFKDNGFDINAIAFKDESDRTRHLETSAGYDRTREVELPYEHGISTSAIITRIQEREIEHINHIAVIRQLFACRWKGIEWLLAEQMLKDLTHFLETHGIAYFLAFGSLLGAVRHQDIIPWDDDIDIAITQQDEQRFVSLAHAFSAFGYGVIKFETKTEFCTEIYYKIWILNRPSTCGKQYSWPFIDVFVLRPSATDPDKCGLDHREFPRSYIFPLKTAPFGTFDLPIPNNPDLLEILYEPDYLSTCVSTNYIHSQERLCSQIIVRPTGTVVEAGCFVHVHELAHAILQSIPMRCEGWSLIVNGESMHLSGNGTQLEANPFIATIWNMLDGTLSTGEIFNTLDGPRIETIRKGLNTLGALRNNKAIKLIDLD